MDRHDVFTADECFLTGTAAEVIPVVECDGRVIGTGRPGPITRELRAAVPSPGPRGALSEAATRRDRDPAPSWPRPTSAPTPSRPCATPAGWPSGWGRSCTCCTSSPRSSPPAPTRCLMPVMPPEFYKENEDRAQETLDRSLDPSWGKPALGRHRRPLGQPGRVDRLYADDHRDRPDRHRHPRPDRPEPRPAGLGRRADRPRGPLPRPDDPRSDDRRRADATLRLRSMHLIGIRRPRRGRSTTDTINGPTRPSRVIYRGRKIDLALQTVALGRRHDRRARGRPAPRRRRPGADGRRRARLPGPEPPLRGRTDAARSPRRHDRPRRVARPDRRARAAGGDRLPGRAHPPHPRVVRHARA